MSTKPSETLLLRFHGEPFSNQLCDELLSRLNRVSELEAENSVLREMNLALNASSIAGKKAIDKLERIKGLIYKYCQKQDCDTCNALTCPIIQERCDMTYDLKDILAEEGT